MHKRKTAKKMTLNRETLHRLESNELRKVAGQAEAAGSWESDCGFTCGENSCLGVCTLNCSWIPWNCPTRDAQ